MKDDRENQRIVLTREELLAEEESDLFDSVPASGPFVPGKEKQGLSGTAFSPLVLGTLAGLLGGFISWLVVEPFISDTNGGVEGLAMLFVLGLGIGGPIGLLLGALEGISGQVWVKAAKGGLLGLLIGGGGGALGSLIAEAVYAELGGGTGQHSFGAQMLVRAFAWSLVGAFIGVGQGALGGLVKRLVNGLVGGILGGFAGGVLFDPIAAVSGSGEMSRMIGFSVLGLLIGLAISLVEQVRKTYWLQVISGPLTGKQYILYRPLTRVGSSPKADITLPKDASVAPLHCELHAEPSRCTVRAIGSGLPTLVNDQPIVTRTLRSGDVIGVGTYRLRFFAQAERGK